MKMSKDFEILSYSEEEANEFIKLRDEAYKFWFEMSDIEEKIEKEYIEPFILTNNSLAMKKLRSLPETHSSIRTIILRSLQNMEETTSEENSELDVKEFITLNKRLRELEGFMSDANAVLTEKFFHTFFEMKNESDFLRKLEVFIECLPPTYVRFCARDLYNSTKMGLV